MAENNKDEERARSWSYLHPWQTLAGGLAVAATFAFGSQHYQEADVCDARVSDPRTWLTAPLCTAWRGLVEIPLQGPDSEHPNPLPTSGY